MTYLPDTNAWIAYVNPGASRVKSRFLAHPPADIMFGSMVKAELLYGPYRSARRADNLIVVTHNTREFARVAGLLLEDWT